MVNLSPLQLDAEREIVVEDHDHGRNWRDCPFTRTGSCFCQFLWIFRLMKSFLRRWGTLVQLRLGLIIATANQESSSNARSPESAESLVV